MIDFYAIELTIRSKIVLSWQPSKEDTIESSRSFGRLDLSKHWIDVDVIDAGQLGRVGRRHDAAGRSEESGAQSAGQRVPARRHAAAAAHGHVPRPAPQTAALLQQGPEGRRPEAHPQRTGQSRLARRPFFFVDRRHERVGGLGTQVIKKQGGAGTANSATYRSVSSPAGKKPKLAALLEDIFAVPSNSVDHEEEHGSGKEISHGQVTSSLSLPENIAQSELQCYENEEAVSLEEPQPLRWWKAREGQYKVIPDPKTISSTASTLFLFCFRVSVSVAAGAPFPLHLRHGGADEARVDHRGPGLDRPESRAAHRGRHRRALPQPQLRRRLGLAARLFVTQLGPSTSCSLPHHIWTSAAASVRSVLLCLFCFSNADVQPFFCRIVFVKKGFCFFLELQT